MGLSVAINRRFVAHRDAVHTSGSVAVAGRQNKIKGNDTASASTRAAPMASVRAKRTGALPLTVTQRHHATAAERTRPDAVLIGIPSQ